MSFISWNDEYSVGVKEIDHQHQKLMAIINRLYEIYKIKTYTGTDAEPIFKELFDYADYHFGVEEHYFEIYKYPKAAEHVGIHNIYRAKIKELKAKYDTNRDSAVLFEISNFLNDWWIWHINNVDKEYTKYFNANGLF